jgi:hypothetical protein
MMLKKDRMILGTLPQTAGADFKTTSNENIRVVWTRRLLCRAGGGPSNSVGGVKTGR